METKTEGERKKNKEKRKKTASMRIYNIHTLEYNVHISLYILHSIVGSHKSLPLLTSLCMCGKIFPYESCARG